MFFRKKVKADETEASMNAAEPAVAGTMPEVTEIDLSAEAEEPHALETSLNGAALPAATPAADAIRLFPGFEREDFEVGFSAGAVPSLVMRWKDGGDWFRMPPMFNRAVLASMDERDSAGDLNRLLRSFGYEVEAA